MWAEHIDPNLRHEALSIVNDELGYPWLTWRDPSFGRGRRAIPRRYGRARSTSSAAA